MITTEKIERKIIEFHQDDNGDWIALMECGHKQHMRHRPPWIVRPWVVTARGREKFIGSYLICKECTSVNS